MTSYSVGSFSNHQLSPFTMKQTPRKEVTTISSLSPLIKSLLFPQTIPLHSQLENILTNIEQFLSAAHTHTSALHLISIQFKPIITHHPFAMRLFQLATAFLAPLHVLAFVQFTNNDFKGITAGQAFTLTWSGDGTVRASFPLLCPTSRESTASRRTFPHSDHC